MAASNDNTCPSFPCDDFGEFQEILKKERTIDDKIVYALNTSIPTASFKGQVDASETCKKLYEQMEATHTQREQAIKKCIAEASEAVAQTKQQKEQNPDNIDLILQLRKDQSRLRLLQNELNIEEVIQDRSMKIFYERCRHAYKPPKHPVL